MLYPESMGNTSKKPRGRPSLGDKAMTTPKTIRFPPALVVQIDAEIDKRLDAPDFAAMVRELCAEALEARRKRK